MKSKSIFLCKLKWAIAAFILNLLEDEEENPMKSGRILKIEPDKDTTEGGFQVKIKRKKHPVIYVSFGPNEDPIKKWKYRIGELVYLPCAVI